MMENWAVIRNKLLLHLIITKLMFEIVIFAGLLDPNVTPRVNTTTSGMQHIHSCLIWLVVAHITDTTHILLNIVTAPSTKITRQPLLIHHSHG